MTKLLWEESGLTYQVWQSTTWLGHQNMKKMTTSYWWRKGSVSIWQKIGAKILEEHKDIKILQKKLVIFMKY